MTGDVEKPRDRTHELADTLGMSALEFAELFGAGWAENEAEPWHDFDGDPSGGGGMPATPWMIAGTPPQLMIRVFHHGVFLAEPAGEWRQGTHGLEYQPRRQQYLARQELDSRGRASVDELLRHRRRSFSHCRFCRERTSPELRVEKDVCMGCAAVWLGVVY